MTFGVVVKNIVSRAIATLLLRSLTLTLMAIACTTVSSHWLKWLRNMFFDLRARKFYDIVTPQPFAIKVRDTVHSAGI